MHREDKKYFDFFKLAGTVRVLSRFASCVVVVTFLWLLDSILAS